MQHTSASQSYLLSYEACLPPVRRFTTRHGAASLMLAREWTEDRARDTLGHVSSNLYTAVHLHQRLPEGARAAAESNRRPRQRRAGQVTRSPSLRITFACSASEIPVVHMGTAVGAAGLAFGPKDQRTKSLLGPRRRRGEHD
ncbi:hypothetical protein GCM10020220_029210 [Nonomuraea rubra]